MDQRALRAKRDWEHSIEERKGQLGLQENEDEPQFSRKRRGVVKSEPSVPQPIPMDVGTPPPSEATLAPPLWQTLLSEQATVLPPRPGATMYKRSGSALDALPGSPSMTADACLLIQDYRLVRVVGRGTYGVIIRCLHWSDPERWFACKIQFAEGVQQREYLATRQERFVQAINEIRVQAVLTDILVPGIYSRSVAEQRTIDREILLHDHVLTANVVLLFDWVKCSLDVRKILEPLLHDTQFEPELQTIVRRLYGRDARDTRPLRDISRLDQMISISEFVEGTDLWALGQSAPYHLLLNANLFNQCIIQMLCTLVYLQRTVRFTHYDFRAGNILVTPVPLQSLVHSSTLVYSVVLDDSNYNGRGATQQWVFYSGGEFVFKINDFGFSRLESALPVGSASRPDSPELTRRVRMASDVEDWASTEFDVSYDVNMLGCNLATMLLSYLRQNRSEPLLRIPLSTISMIEFMMAPPEAFGSQHASARLARLSMRTLLRKISRAISEDLQHQFPPPLSRKTINDLLTVNELKEITKSFMHSDERSPMLALSRGDSGPGRRTRPTPSAVLYRYSDVLAGVRKITIGNIPSPRPAWISEMAARSAREALPHYSGSQQLNENETLLNQNLYDALYYLPIDAQGHLPRNRDSPQTISTTGFFSSSVSQVGTASSPSIFTVSSISSSNPGSDPSLNAY